MSVLAWAELASSPGLRGEGKGRPGDEARAEPNQLISQRDRQVAVVRSVDWRAKRLRPAELTDQPSSLSLNGYIRQ